MAYGYDQMTTKVTEWHLGFQPDSRRTYTSANLLRRTTQMQHLRAAALNAMPSLAVWNIQRLRLQRLTLGCATAGHDRAKGHARRRRAA